MTSGRAAKTSVELIHDTSLKVQRTVTKKGLRCAAPLSQNLVLHAYRRFGGAAAGRSIQDYSID